MSDAAQPAMAMAARACGCANPDCRINGCQIERAERARQGASWPGQAWPTTPKGCICPPTAEQTCQRPDCGRKPANMSARATAAMGGAAR